MTCWKRKSGLGVDPSLICGIGSDLSLTGDLVDSTPLTLMCTTKRDGMLQKIQEHASFFNCRIYDRQPLRNIAEELELIMVDNPADCPFLLNESPSSFQIVH
jgi:hypothetical protein